MRIMMNSPATSENPDTLMNIRQMCDHYDVTPRTLRFYEQKELLFPVRDGQKRLFTRRDRGRLKLILRGKRFGFSLEEIRQLLDLYNEDDHQLTQMKRTYEVAKHHLVRMESQREALSEAITDLKSQMTHLIAQTTNTQEERSAE